jgi:oxygen-independent coproporphyrinogen-3 oxidase
LPRQSAASWRSTLERLIAMAPDRVALSCYQHRPDQAPAQHAIDSAALPDGALCAELRSMTATAMLSAGYAPVGSGQFVLDDDELALARPEGRLRRNLIGYTATPAVPLLGLGAGAVGEIDGSMFWNHTALRAWHGALHDGQLPVARARMAGAEAAQLIGATSGGQPRWLT